MVMVASAPVSSVSVALTSMKPLLCVRCTSAAKPTFCSWPTMCSDWPETAEPTRGSSPASWFFTAPSSADTSRMRPEKLSGVTANSIANRCLFSKHTRRRLFTFTLRPCGEVHSTVRVSTPVRKSSTRSYACTEPLSRSKRSSSIHSSMPFAFGTFSMNWLTLAKP